MPQRATFPYKVFVSKIALACAIIAILTVIKTYPLIQHIGTHMPSDSGDPVLVTWILAWGFHAMTNDPWNLFNANIFYPVQNTLALSEHMIAVAPLFGLSYLITGNPIFAYNLVFLLSFIFCGISMFLLVHHWTENFWAALLSGCLFAFAPIRFAEISHLQLNNFYWAPLVFLFLDRFINYKRWFDLTYFAVFYWLQVLCSVYLGWFITIAVGIYVLYWSIYIDRGLLDRAMVTYYSVFIVSSLIIILPFHVPYYKIKQQLEVLTVLQHCTYWSADLFLNYFSPPHLFNDVYLSLVRYLSTAVAYPRNEMLLFPGFIVAALVAVAILPLSTLVLSPRELQLKKLFGLVLISSFLLSLGPYLLVLGMNTGIPLPFQLFYYLAPGFQAMRVPARFAIMAGLAACVLAGLGFLKVCDVLRGRRRVKKPRVLSFEGRLALLLIGMFMAELGFKPLPLVSMPTADQVPEVYRWLSTGELGGPILELPHNQREALKYMYFSTYHWLPLVNGASGYAPSAHTQLSAEIAALPSPQAVELLRAIGVKGLILHTDRLEPHDASRWQHVKLAELGLEEMARFGSDLVYKLNPLETTPQLHVELAVPNQLPGGETIRLPQRASLGLRLLAETLSHRFWTHPQPLGETKAIIEWKELQTSKKFVQQAALKLPVAIKAEEIWSTTLTVNTPPVPGRYVLSLFMPAFGFKAAPKLMEVTDSLYPESAMAPQLLSAVYLLEEAAFQEVASRDINLGLQAVNTGRAVWLARAKDDRGAVRLGWRWFNGKEERPFREGRAWLSHDVFPGQAYRFRTTIDAPSKPGDYKLDVGLVSELVTWFSDRGVAPLTLDVRVQMNTDVRVHMQRIPSPPERRHTDMPGTP
jgi:hypothetical protein